MAVKTLDEIQGVEFDWLATDGDGCVAFFATGGGGYAPEEFLVDTDAHATAIRSILSLPATTVARFSPDLKAGYENTWREMAERGIFAFDCDVNGGPYELAASPLVPIKVGDLPVNIAGIPRATRFPHLRFSVLTVVSERLLRNE